MEIVTLNKLRKWQVGIGVLLMLAHGVATAATPYTYTSSVGLHPTLGGSSSPPSPASITSGTQFVSGDTLEVASGTMATGSNSAVGWTVGLSNTGVSITVDANATLSYAGSSGSGAAIFYSISSNSAATSGSTSVAVNGTLSAGTGLYAISMTNSNSTPADTFNIAIYNNAAVSGAILSNNVNSVNLNITGTPTIEGAINLPTYSTGLSTLTVGGSGAATFTPVDTISNIGYLHITNSSTLNLDVTNANMKTIAIDANSVLNLAATLNGLSAGDGGIINNGTINLYAGIAKYGTYTGSGINQVYEGAATGLSITTANYSVTNHYVVMTDLNNYGNITLATADFTASNFKVIYGTGGNTAGYFPGGTYTLVTATNGTVSTPTWNTSIASSLFLSFAQPTVVGNDTIQMVVTRTPFTSYASSPLTQSIAANIETIGSSGNVEQSFLDVLDAVEQSSAGSQLEFALEQLAPLADAPFYGYIMQDSSMYQAKMRLAELRNGTSSYVAGDLVKDTHAWFRGFGSYANQQPKDDSFGYYATSGGVIGGLDRDLDDRYTMGAAFVYALSHVTDKVNPQSTTKFKSYIGMVYGTYNYSDVEYLDWIIAVTCNTFSASRNVNINSMYNQVATSSYSSQQASAMGVYGKNYEAFGFMELTPEAMAQYTFAKQYAYTESGAPGANLGISRTNSDIVTLGVGGIAAIPVWVNPSIVIPDIHGWAYYNPIIGRQNTVFTFVTGGGPITSTFNMPRTSLLIGAALTIAVVDKLEVKVNFDYEVADRFKGYTAYFNLRYFF